MKTALTLAALILAFSLIIPTRSQAELVWVREQFSTAWNIEYPVTWTVNRAGLHEGRLSLHGDYRGQTYEIRLSYPLFTDPDLRDNFTLKFWVEHDLRDATSVDSIEDLTVAGADAKYARGVVTQQGPSPTHRLYIWRYGNANPRFVYIQQVGDGPTNMQAMTEVIDRFIAGIEEAQYRAIFPLILHGQAGQ
jgi:hypothetical protein